MGTRNAHPLALVALVAALATAGCDDLSVRTSIGPSDLAATGLFTSVQVGIRPAPIDPVFVGAPLCPARPPYLAPFDLVVHAGDGLELSINQFQMQFVDTFGRLGASRRIDRPEIVSLFGSPRIPAFGSRTFPLSLPIGCAGLTTGVINVIVLAADVSGHQRRLSLDVGVR
jgi:hypothetical protein